MVLRLNTRKSRSPPGLSKNRASFIDQSNQTRRSRNAPAGFVLSRCLHCQRAQALQDIKDIFDWIVSRPSYPTVAEKFVNRIHERCERLGNFQCRALRETICNKGCAYWALSPSQSSRIGFWSMQSKSPRWRVGNFRLVEYHPNPPPSFMLGACGTASGFTLAWISLAKRVMMKAEISCAATGLPVR